MSNTKKLREMLRDSFAGGVDPETGLVGRRFERTQGCWNCIHGDFDAAKKFWLDRREQDLKIAIQKAMASPMGENEPSVVNIRRLVDAIDVGLRTHNLTHCTGKGKDANGNPVGDFVKSNYLCSNWSARQGASVARGGQKADDLPMELEDKNN